MPDGDAQTYVYKRAVRDKTAPLIMIAGPPGVGKTMSALRLARGMAGPDGKIFFADTDNGRALFYADDFTFEHLNLHEPFRPMVFEEAAKTAQRQGASVLVIDNFMAEHAGPGGLLEWHDEVNIRMATDRQSGEVDRNKLESTKVLAWATVKPAHKKMRERLYQLNMPVVLACGAEKKLAMVKQTEGRDKGKTIPVDQGLVPICGADIPWAMTISLMLPDPRRPGVPVPIKALMPPLIPIISLEKPLDEETGAGIAAWARGDKPAMSASSPTKEATAPASPAPVSPPATSSAGTPPPPQSPPAAKPGKPDPEKIAGDLIAQFQATTSLKAHLAVVDEDLVRKQLDWLKRNRRPDWERVNEALKASYRKWNAPTSQQPGLPMEGPP